MLSDSASEGRKERMIPPRDFNALFRHGESRLGSNDAAMAYCVIRGARVKEAIECVHSETLSVPLYPPGRTSRRFTEAQTVRVGSPRHVHLGLVTGCSSVFECVQV